jgi:4-hydroxy-3-methylbut-2-en-1-yl diphosphate synthase IspG/GcpE
MVVMQCKICKAIICEDVARIKDIKWISCPSCYREPFLNPYFEEKEE